MSRQSVGPTVPGPGCSAGSLDSSPRAGSVRTSEFGPGQTAGSQGGSEPNKNGTADAEVDGVVPHLRSGFVRNAYGGACQEMNTCRFPAALTSYSLTLGQPVGGAAQIKHLCAIFARLSLLCVTRVVRIMSAIPPDGYTEQLSDRQFVRSRKKDCHKLCLTTLL